MPNPQKISAVRDMKPPRTVKQVKSFVQMCSWYRKFINNFSEIARPLTNLLKNNSTFKFGSEEARAFECLKDKLISAPVLVQADQSQPYVLRTDASSYALGAVLLQGEGQEERPVEYASILMTPAEQRYSTTEREALAVVWATDKFRSYIEGARVKIATGHQPLQWLLTMKTTVGRLARWALRIQGLNMDIVYSPGKLNVVADALSRPVELESGESNITIDFVSVDFPKIGSEEFRKRQMSDSHLKLIIDALESADPVEFVRWSERGYILVNGILYKESPDIDSESAQLVLPQDLREELLKDYHDAASAGHYGTDRTYAKISSKFYFVGMRKFIADYIKVASNVKGTSL